MEPKERFPPVSFPRKAIEEKNNLYTYSLFTAVACKNEEEICCIWLLGSEALKLSFTLTNQAEIVGLSHQYNIISCGSRILRTLAQVWGRAAPLCYILCALPKFLYKHIKQI